RITSVIVSAQHEDAKDFNDLVLEIKGKVIAYCLAEFDTSKTEILVNPSGRFVLGGFEADTGLTGRKLMVDSYGGSAHHGGGAYSGKDPSKVDRSGAYMARYVAKNIVASGLAEKCEVMLSYAIGKAEPTAVDIDTFYTGAVSEELIKRAVLKVFDLTPRGIIESLELKKPIYASTAVGGHFGNDKYSWEKLD
ncbi:MAG: methionine adenosyltransferase domain-containing protein, partial [Clostridia bacterium]